MFKPIYKTTRNGVTANLTFKSSEKTGWLGYVSIEVNDFISIKASICRSKGGKNYFRMPQIKKGEEYIDQVIPMNKDAASTLRDLADDIAEYIIGPTEETFTMEG